MLDTNVNYPDTSPGSTHPTEAPPTQAADAASEVATSGATIAFFRSLFLGSLEKVAPYLERFTATQRERESETRQS